MSDFDLIVVGGGIVGLASAREFMRAYPGLSVAVLEKEPAIAGHQTGRNSGVIHAGVYYAPGSLKARFCREGSADTMAFCREHGIPFDQCGKLIVATEEAELPRLKALTERARANGLDIEEMDGPELARREPHIRGIAGFLVKASGIVDYRAVAEAMAGEITAGGGTILTGAEVTGIEESPAGVSVETRRGRFTAPHLVACAGLMADRIARMCGVAADFRIVPFRGEYYRLAHRHDHIVQHLIYPVPDPDLPFLGVHLTRMIGGYVTVGPNAVLAFAREGYRFGDVNLRDLAEMIAYPGFRRAIRNNLRSGIDEMRNSLSKAHYLELCRRYCPELTLEDLMPYRAGVRAQAVLRDGTLLHDFLIEGTAATVHVCNAPSPAATSAMPIARHIVAHAATQWKLKGAPVAP
ncbi:L-2-hydroxyglutarate oxidase [Ancylobacter sp. 6x-1]|uniref:L-2-hydroxyglutarate oxidase n=1 Tax=Ancylobacter crimeensis TaxID=2579147 RepID=A0ABT0DAK8_9HYPH|nr:L-2-hydroxyglutarate oxidase [Ancylobacter crimeensis]MCK0196939.1 L-2-hydroxyglutarate oxidase [Ancylobacter crimeensis]